MAKMRGYKPEFFTDDKVVTLSVYARLLFLGMWSQACDNGHLEDKPLQLKMRLLPMDDVDVDELLDEIAATGMLTRGDGLIAVRNLTKHQSLDMRYYATCQLTECEHPDPTRARKGKRGHTREHDVAPRVPVGAHGHTGAHVGAQGVPVGAHDEGEGEGEGEKNYTPSKARALTLAPEPVQASSAVADGGFDDFWKLYPRKVGKAPARKAWSKARKSVSAERLVQALEVFQATEWRDRPQDKLPHCTTWLNTQPWTDLEDLTAVAEPAENPIDRTNRILAEAAVVQERHIALRDQEFARLGIAIPADRIMTPRMKSDFKEDTLRRLQWQVGQDVPEGLADADEDTQFLMAQAARTQLAAHG